MNHCGPATAAMLVVLLTPLAGGAEDFGDGHARAQLVSGRIEQGSDERLYLGVRFDIEPGWHIYWKNPGGAGMATEVLWRLPDGLEAGELQWPLPIFFLQSGDIPGYGYEESVVLASELAAPALPQDTVVGAEVSWLACKDVCVLGSARLESPWNEVETDPVFTEWRDTLPTAFEAADAPFTVSTTGGLGDGKLVIWLRWNSDPLSADWFPEPLEGLVVKDVTVKTRGGLTRIDAGMRLMAGADGAYATLPSLLVVTNDDYRRRGWRVDLDLGGN